MEEEHPRARQQESAAAQAAATQALDFEARALALLTPSLVHRMRNSFMVFSTHAQLLSMGEALAARAARGHAALRAELDRSLRVLDLVATAAHSSDADFSCLGSLGNALADFLSIDVRGRRLPVVADVHAQIKIRREARAWLVASVLAMEALARAHADLGASAIRWKAHRGEEPRLELSVDGPEGLPFPSPKASLDAQLVVYCAREGLVLDAAPGRIRIHEA